MSRNEAVDLSEKLVLITGGNSGIGKHTAIGLAKRGAQVVITSRNPDKGQAALAEIREASGGGKVELMRLDLASFDSIRAFAASFTQAHDRLDSLINNAGLIIDERRETEEGFEMTFGVNHLGHFLLTRELLPLLEKTPGARLINLASDAHKAARKGMSWDDLQRTQSYGGAGFAAYGESKLANILFTREFAKRHGDADITAVSVHPGAIRSGFGMDGDMSGVAGLIYKVARPFMKTPAKGAETSVYLASAPLAELEPGGYYANCKPARSTRFARDDAAARRLWELSEAWIEDPARARA